MLPPDLIDKPLFADLTPEQVSRLAPIFEPFLCHAGEQMFAQGEAAQCVYVLESGEVALRLHPEDGGLMTIAVIHPGGIFGWSAALGRPRYTSAAVCLTDVHGVMIRGDALRTLVRADPVLGRRLLGRMALDVAARGDDEHSDIVRLIQSEMDYADVRGG
jgi:CRP-like cAMP-binding protein